MTARRELVTYGDVDAWHKRGEAIRQHLTTCRRSSAKAACGSINHREDNNSKEKRSRMKVVMENFQSLGSRPEDDGRGHEG